MRLWIDRAKRIWENSPTLRYYWSLWPLYAILGGYQLIWKLSF